MNAVGTIVQQFMELPKSMQQNQNIPLDQQMVFQNLMLAALEITNAGDNSGVLRGTSDSADKRLLNNGTEEMTRADGPEKKSDEMMAELLEILSNKFSVSEENPEMDKLGVGPIELQTPPQMMNGQMVQKQFSRIIKKAEEILGQLNGQKSIMKAAPELLKLLEQWSALAKKSGYYTSAQLQLPDMINGGKQTVWKELVQSFQKRNQLAMREQYSTNAKVTAQDVAKWLQRAVQNQASFDAVTTKKSSTVSSAMPMSKVEQYVIHLNQTNAQPVSHELVEKFQNIMKTSKFISLQNGTSQLNIALRPENLGDMVVKMTQVNGEMTVKIIVSSAAAKDMLESNMHQLRNMFSPQQVVIEKEVISSHQSQASQQEDDHQQTDDHREGQSEQSDQHSEESAEEEDFDAQLQAVLMNEKV